MNNNIEYKGYIGSIEYSEDDGIFFGKVQGIRSLILYEGENAKDLIDDFHGAIDDYLKMCKDEKIEPEKAYKGTFNVRIRPELHKTAVQYALSHEMTLNRFVEEAISEKLYNNKNLIETK